MIAIKNICLAYGGRKLFDGVTATLGARDRIGLVGLNGAGKSTLLKVLTGNIEPDAGEVEMAKYVTLGYLPQDVTGCRGRSLIEEAETAFQAVKAIQQQLDAASERLASLDSEYDEYAETLELIGHLSHQLEDHEADKMRSRTEQVLHGLGFKQEDMQRDCGEFSGGWQMRIALAKLLLQEPSMLLLDEPTNHLDIVSIRWLELFLSRYNGGVIIVSHDRAFLDQFCTRTLALRRGKMEDYAGNYTYFEQESVIRRGQIERAAMNQQRQIAQTERFIERFRAKNTKAAQVQSRIKMLDKIDRIEVEAGGDKEVAFRFPEPKRSGQVVLSIEGLHKSYGDLHVLKGLDWKIERGERVAVVGVNGAGKSTLVKALAGVLPFEAGERKTGHNVELSYFAQHQADSLDPASTVLEEADRAAPPGEGRRVRDLLGAFLFSGDDVQKKVKVLSGGEKNRLALAKMLLQSFNCLILDEPTNHLDMQSKGVLQNALKEYPGTMIIVSHDRAFLDPVVHRVLELSAQHGIRMFEGNVSEYVAKTEAEWEGLDDGNRKAEGGKEEMRADGGLSAKERRKQVAERNKQLKPLKNKSEKLEAQIAAWESEKDDLEAAMADPEFFKAGAETKEKMQHHESLNRKIERAMLDWERVLEEIAAVEEA